MTLGDTLRLVVFATLYTFVWLCATGLCLRLL